jgi:hypothetical protein
LIEKIKLPDAQARNEAILEDDEEILEISHQDDDDDVDAEPIQDFNEVEDLELAKALEDAYLTPPPSEEDDDSPYAFHVQYPIDQEIQDHVKETQDRFNSQGVFGDEAKVSFNADRDDRFEDFVCEKVTSPCHGSFNAGRKLNLDSRLRGSFQKACRKRDIRLHKTNLPPPPQSIQDLETHPLRDHFKEAQRAHLESHQQMKSFQEMDKKHAKGQQTLSSMWVFVYKTDKHGFLQKCKARLVVCGNQQAPGDLPTRATTLAGMAFRTLMAVTAKFDLETIQMDAVNAFVHCDLDEVVYMRFPPGFNQGKRDKVLRLRKALYGLRRSPLLWQKNLTSSLRELGFKEVPQEPCVMLKGGIVVFFYVDDIVFCHRKGDEEKVQDVIKGLKTEYKMSVLGELKWFLGIHVLRDRSQRLLWLSQEAYVEKIAKQYEIDLTSRFPDTPMTECELLPTTYPRSIRPMLKSADKALPKVADASTLLYQKKMGSMLYAATTTRPDIAFAVSRLARFNQDPVSLWHEE